MAVTEKYSINLLSPNDQQPSDREAQWNHFLTSGSVLETKIGKVKYFGASFQVRNGRHARSNFKVVFCSNCEQQMGRVYLKVSTTKWCNNPIAQFPLFTSIRSFCCPALAEKMRNHKYHNLNTILQAHPKSPDQNFCEKVWAGDLPFDSLRLWGFQCSGPVTARETKRVAGRKDRDFITVAGQEFVCERDKLYTCTKAECYARGVLVDTTDKPYFVVTKVHLHPVPDPQELPKSAKLLRRAEQPQQHQAAPQDGPGDQGSPASQGAVSRSLLRRQRPTQARAVHEASPTEKASEGEAAALPPEHVLSKAPREGASPSRRQRPTQARTGREASSSDSEKCGGGAVGSRDAPQSRASISPESASLVAQLQHMAEELRLRASKKNKQQAQQQQRHGDTEPPHASSKLLARTTATQWGAQSGADSPQRHKESSDRTGKARQRVTEPKSDTEEAATEQELKGKARGELGRAGHRQGRAEDRPADQRERSATRSHRRPQVLDTAGDRQRGESSAEESPSGDSDEVQSDMARLDELRKLSKQLELKITKKMEKKEKEKLKASISQPMPGSLGGHRGFDQMTEPKMSKQNKEKCRSTSSSSSSHSATSTHTESKKRRRPPGTSESDTDEEAPPVKRVKRHAEETAKMSGAHRDVVGQQKQNLRSSGVHVDVLGLAATAMGDGGKEVSVTVKPSGETTVRVIPTAVNKPEMAQTSTSPPLVNFPTPQESPTSFTPECSRSVQTFNAGSEALPSKKSEVDSLLDFQQAEMEFMQQHDEKTRQLLVERDKLMQMRDVTARQMFTQRGHRLQQVQDVVLSTGEAREKKEE